MNSAGGLPSGRGTGPPSVRGTGPPSGRGAGRSRPAWITGAVAEARRLTAEPLVRLRRGRLPLAFGSAASVLLLWSLHFSALGTRIVRLISDVSASTPFALAVARLPASMYAPAPNLPVWGSLLQVLAVFGIAETYLGRRRTLTIALTATFLCTLSGRIMCYLGPHTIVGLPWIARYASDTGPSAAVVALVAYLCCVRRAPRTLTVLLTAMVTEVTLLPNLAGREHVVAITLGVVAALAGPAAARLRRASRAAPPVAVDAVTPAAAPAGPSPPPESGIVRDDHAGLR